MKAADFRDLNLDELEQKVRDLDEQLFRMRMQKSMAQLDSPGKIKDVRRDLARVKTVMREKSK